jgi:hypothetical protein
MMTRKMLDGEQVKEGGVFERRRKRALLLLELERTSMVRRL